MTADLLPPNRSVFEEGLVDALTDDLPVPFRGIMNPETAPAEWLPFLAVNESVDLWYSDWPEARKRQMIAEAIELAALKGTHEGAVRYLSYVDAEVVDTVSYPARFVMGQSALGITPINHPPFKARYLVKVYLARPVNAYEMYRSAIGKAALRSVDRTPVMRAKRALEVSKAPETEYLISVAWRRQNALRDEIALSDERNLGGWTDRTRL